MQLLEPSWGAKQVAEKYAADFGVKGEPVCFSKVEGRRTFTVVFRYSSDATKWYEAAMLPNGRGWTMDEAAPPAHRDPDPREVFKLSNKPRRPRPAKFQSNQRARQMTLIEGLACLPGQQDLF